MPSHCNCEDEAKWNSFNQTKEEHGHEYTDKIEDYPKEVLEEVEQMTKADKLVYQTGTVVTVVASGKVIEVDS